jgi:hypothetical protein
MKKFSVEKLEIEQKLVRQALQQFAGFSLSVHTQIKTLTGQMRPENRDPDFDLMTSALQTLAQINDMSDRLQENMRLLIMTSGLTPDEIVEIDATYHHAVVPNHPTPPMIH